MTVRLEEYDTGVVKQRVPSKLTKNLNGMKDDGSLLQAKPDAQNPGRYVFETKLPQAGKGGSSTGGGSFAPSTSSDGLTHVINGVIPMSFEWSANGIRAADELVVELRADDFPLDPRCVRSVIVEFFLGTVTSVEFAMGARGKTRGEVFGSGVPNANEPMSMVPDTYADDRGGQRSNLRFQGFADVGKMRLAEGDAPTVTLECRDFTQQLIDQTAPPRLVVGAKDPLDKAVAVYLSNFPQYAGFSVEFIGEPGQKAPVLSEVLAKTAFRPQLGPQPSGAGGEDDLTVWDYLTDVCGAVGLVVFVDGTRIIIARPSTLLGGRGTTRTDDPYKGRHLQAGDFPVRALIYGRNLQTLGIDRNFASLDLKNVELRCYSPRQKKLLVARYPTKKDRIATANPGDTAENKWNVIRVRGVENQELLDQMAKDYFNMRGRTEIEVQLRTKVLASFGGGNADPDLLDARATDAIEVLVDRAGDASWSKVEGRLQAEEACTQHLIRLGYREDFARRYAKVRTAAGFQTVFRLREAKWSGAVDEGVTVEMKLANFVQVRGELGDAPKAAASNKAASKAAQKPQPAAMPKNTAPSKAGRVQVGTLPNGTPIFADVK